MTSQQPKTRGTERGRREYVKNNEEAHMSRKKVVTDFEMYGKDPFPEKHSAFKRPYMEDDYHEMEYAYSPPFRMNPKWWAAPGILGTMGGGGSEYTITWGIPQLTTDSGVETEYFTWGFVSYCVLTCWPPSLNDDCDEPIECYTSISNGPDQAGRVRASSNDGSVGRIVIERSGITPIKIYPASVWGPDDDPSIVIVTFSEPNGNVCSATVTINCEELCCDDPNTSTFTWSAGNPTTISANETKTIFVTGGCPPYAWVLTGGEGTITLGSGAGTEGSTNSLVADADACGTVTVTVTDFCGTIVNSDPITNPDANSGWRFRHAFGPESTGGYDEDEPECVGGAEPGPSFGYIYFEPGGEMRDNVLVCYDGIDPNPCGSTETGPMDCPQSGNIYNHTFTIPGTCPAGFPVINLGNSYCWECLP